MAASCIMLDPFCRGQFKGFNAFNFIAKKSDAVTIIHIRQVNVNRIAFYPESASCKIALAAVVQTIDQRM